MTEPKMYRLQEQPKWPFTMSILFRDTIVCSFSRKTESTQDTLSSCNARPENAEQKRYVMFMVEAANKLFLMEAMSQ